MFTLLLKLRAPMQSWGHQSRFHDRHTGSIPTKSGVLGLIAASQGRRRTDPIEDLAKLTFAVRTDQPGTLMRDYQTAERWQTGGGTSLVSRYYLADAVFVAAVASEDRKILESLEEALKNPRFPLFLGRRSCPVGPDLVLGIRDVDPVTALRDEPWQATLAHRKSRATSVVLPIHRDGEPHENGLSYRDVPVSFSQEHRQYGWRTVVQEPDGARFSNPDGSETADAFFEAVISA